MNSMKTILLVLIYTGFSAIVYSQDNSSNHKINIEIPDVALLGLVSTNPGSVNVNSLSPNEAGNSVHFSENAQNSGIWINYSSINRDKNHQRKVIAMIQGELPNGISLFVEATDADGTGKGKLGDPTGVIALSNQPKDVITGIGSSYTGKGINNGHLLNYKLQLDESAENYALLSHGQSSVNVIYTLTDQN